MSDVGGGDVFSAVSSTFGGAQYHHQAAPCPAGTACACITGGSSSVPLATTPASDDDVTTPGSRKRVVKAQLLLAAASVHGILERHRRRSPPVAFTQHEMQEITAAANAALGCNLPHVAPRILADVDWGCAVLCDTPENVTEPADAEEAVARRAILAQVAKPFLENPRGRRDFLRFILQRAQGEYPHTLDLVATGGAPAAAALWLAGIPVPVFGAGHDGVGLPIGVEDELTDDEDVAPETVTPAAVDDDDDARDGVKLRHAIIAAAISVFGVEWSVPPASDIVRVAAGDLPPTPHVTDAGWEFVKEVVNGTK